MKSNVSDFLELLHCIYIDACNKCPANVSSKRDLMTIRSRVEDEGTSFLTITLPQFAKDFERSLAMGCIDPHAFQRWKKRGLGPQFLQGLIGRVFNYETGRIYEQESDTPILVEAVRQICLFFKKVELQCSPSREFAATENYVHVELSNQQFSLSAEDIERFSNTSDVLWHNMLAGLQPDMFVPRHGPGATAERISGNRKYVWVRWYERLEKHFPFLGNSYSVSAALERDFEKVTFVQEQDEDPVRVTLVPKTLKGPRIIAIEPVCMQYAQQAIQRALYESVESYWLSAGHVNFTDQSINQRLAISASKEGQFATIDLSDASDRVLNSLASLMFRSNPDLQEAIDNCRSRNAVLPDGRLVGPLSKFASMGSALCFPIEAMYFYTICVMALLDKYDLPLTPRNIFHVTRGVYVYGDDIVVPTCDAGTVLEYLTKYNCKVNNSKTFVTGKFRESCGVDAYDGEEVTPTYLRRIRPENRQQVDRLVSWVATANLLYYKGYWRTASLMFCTCERILGSLPYVSPESAALGRISFLGYRSIDSWSYDTHSFITRGWVAKPVYRSDRVDGYPALQKCLLSLEAADDKSVAHYNAYISDLLKRQKGWFAAQSGDKKHLERSALRGAATLKHRGVPAL